VKVDFSERSYRFQAAKETAEMQAVWKEAGAGPRVARPAENQDAAHAPAWLDCTTPGWPEKRKIKTTKSRGNNNPARRPQMSHSLAHRDLTKLRHRLREKAVSILSTEFFSSSVSFLQKSG